MGAKFLLIFLPTTILTSLFAAISILLSLGTPTPAADYPNRPITLVVAFTPGGPSDVLARIVGKKMEQLLSQPFVIENRPGAGGNLAAEAVAHAAPDGYTLLMGNNSILATNDSLYKRLNYQPKDFVPITLIGTQANILVVNTNVPAHSLKELIALPRRNQASSILPLRGMAPPRISLASCSNRRQRSISCMCPTKALRRPFKM